ADLVVDDQLVEHVHGRDRRLVAGAEDHADAAVAVRPFAIDPSLRRLLAGLDPDVAGDASQEQLVDGALRVYARHPLTVGALPGARQLRLAAGVERLGEDAQVAHDRERAAQILLAVAVAALDVAFDGAGGGRPAVGDREQRAHAGAQQGRALGR